MHILGMEKTDNPNELFGLTTLGLASRRVLDKLSDRPWQAAADGSEREKPVDGDPAQPDGDGGGKGDADEGRPVRRGRDGNRRANGDHEPLPYVVALQRGLSARERDMRGLFGKAPHPDKARTRRRKD